MTVPDNKFMPPHYGDVCFSEAVFNENGAPSKSVILNQSGVYNPVVFAVYQMVDGTFLPHTGSRRDTTDLATLGQKESGVEIAEIRLKEAKEYGVTNLESATAFCATQGPRLKAAFDTKPAGPNVMDMYKAYAMHNTTAPGQKNRR